MVRSLGNVLREHWMLLGGGHGASQLPFVLLPSQSCRGGDSILSSTVLDVHS